MFVGWFTVYAPQGYEANQLSGVFKPRPMPAPVKFLFPTYVEHPARANHIFAIDQAIFCSPN
jgi:hypothetical protein